VAAERWIKAGKIVGVIGGDHSTPFGLIQAVNDRGEFSILQIDAHADLRMAYEGFTWSHASIMRNVIEQLPQATRLVQVGVRDYCEEEYDYTFQMRRVVTYFDNESGDRPWDAQCDEIVECLPPRVYVSFDVDGLEPSLCPHTGTPVPGGLTFNNTLKLLDKLSRKRKIIGFDVCETGNDPWDANVAARILYKLIGYALKSRDE
jgi:agmatinase